MARIRTGRPAGRPKGSGTLGEVRRITVHVPRGLYERLASYAAGRSFAKGTPQLAICVREALEEYMARRTGQADEQLITR